jgi:hypothetical protein
MDVEAVSAAVRARHVQVDVESAWAPGEKHIERLGEEPIETSTAVLRKNANEFVLCEVGEEAD